MKKMRISPSLVLFVLAPACGELLSGSAPPAEFFNPFSFLVMALLYGGGALIIRELIFRWKKSWPSMILLGAAYGIIEEGLMVQSFFNPYWMDLGKLAAYGRWLGVNWIWTAELIIFHAVVSIAIPITLTQLIFPEQKDSSWLSPKWFKTIVILFFLDILVGLVLCGALNPRYPLPWLHLILSSFLVVLLFNLARKVPKWDASFHAQPARRRAFFLAGFTGIFLLFFFSWFLPEIGLPEWVTFLLLAFLPVLMILWIIHLSKGSCLPPRHQLALIAGVISLMAILDQILMLDPNPPDNRAGMWLVGVLFLLFIVWIDRKMIKAGTS